MSSSSRPKYEQIKDDLRLQIIGGDYTPGQSFVTQQQICDIYDVSMLTAARALNELEVEGLVTRRRGKGTFVAETTTVPRENDGTANNILCVVPSLTSGHVSNFVRGVESVCTERGFHLLLADSHGREDRQSQALQRASAGGVDGVIIYPVEGAADHEAVSRLRRADVPIVFADRYWPEISMDAVLLDDFAIGYELTQALIRRGHTRIGTLWGEIAATSVRDRLSGHLRALQEHRLPVLSELTALRSYVPLNARAGSSVLAQMLKAKPTALLCANGFVLASATNELNRSGVRIPEEMELAGMDEAGPYDALPLTVASAAVPSYEMGQRAAEILLDKRIGSHDEDNSERVVLAVTINLHGRVLDPGPAVPRRSHRRPARNPAQ
ncbi:DNA-binding LacI/PurR family transcriptional regulator [Kribbella aluminosa]|uniref:DNA-binding LacI/PurR family transcriptional regulator n=1 Tax=Kribbella aluminosa TaxID=416017 RepID=A0ABS4UWA2_9ACTN|nr:GntR family transcriptional regulator [Kribbella aluminosa]MBP2355940.1 DNA-binding LacI/PurR family transcriptional regulator [Kribbella aluminosa]